MPVKKETCASLVLELLYIAKAEAFEVPKHRYYTNKKPRCYGLYEHNLPWFSSMHSPIKANTTDYILSFIIQNMLNKMGVCAECGRFKRVNIVCGDCRKIIASRSYNYNYKQLKKIILNQRVVKDS